MASKMLLRLVGSSVDGDASPFLIEPKEVKSEPPAPQSSDTTIKSEKEGGQLFELFVFDQVSKNKAISPRLQDFMTRPSECTREVLETAGRLCDMAADFSKTEDRQKVKDAALTVSSHRMRQELTKVLQDMLSESPGLDEGVLVLFFFCLDLSARLLESEHQQVWEVLTWCKAGLDSALGPYVHANGGWAAVGSSTAQVLAAGLTVLDQVKRLVAW